MPGPFTHLMVCDAARTREDLGTQLRQLLNRHYRFLYLGSESPDLAYLSVGGKNWADEMHYKKTNAIVISAFEELRGLWPQRTEAEEIKFAWLMGYVSHMIADATIHPIIEAIVGPYEGNETEHRICEMTIDSLLFHEIMRYDISYADYSEALRFCKDSQYFHEVIDFWEKHLVKNYPLEEEPHPSFWFITYTNAVDIAEEEDGVRAIFRHLGAENYFYKKSNEIERDSPVDCQKYYFEVKFPGGTGPFKQNGFDKAVDNVVGIWKALYQSLSTLGLHVAQLVRNWNLDTGGDSDAGGIKTFWA